MANNPPANPVVINNPPAPAAPAAAQDRTKRSKDIPLFYGQAGKDTISARLLIVRVNDTAAIGNWAVDRKILEFKMCLRDRAQLPMVAVSLTRTMSKRAEMVSLPAWP